MIIFTVPRSIRQFLKHFNLKNWLKAIHFPLHKPLRVNAKQMPLFRFLQATLTLAFNNEGIDIDNSLVVD